MQLHISYLWRDASTPRAFTTGVSLHGHTNQSKESLGFLPDLLRPYPVMRQFMERLERRAGRNHGFQVNYSAAFWTPPLTPKLAFGVESAQIEALGLNALVSLTDHDSIQAPVMLRALHGTSQIPISTEWTVPYRGTQAFHLGVHNLPVESAPSWMATFAEFTADPQPGRLVEILAALNALPGVLVVLNHPAWDLYLVGRERHIFLLREFLQKYGAHFHALELNGLRNWDENRLTRQLAEHWNMPLISGGDRHGVEPSANINITNASSFDEFVHEIRHERRSSVLFLPQYAEPWKVRILQSAIDAVRYYPEFPRGSRSWDDRVFHPDRQGVTRSLAELWPSGTAPLPLRLSIRLFLLAGVPLFSGGLRLAFDDPGQLVVALGESER